MDPGITDIATQLATRIPTGADSEDQAVEDWRTTLYNARATNAMGPLTDMVRRTAPGDATVAGLCDQLKDR